MTLTDQPSLLAAFQELERETDRKRQADLLALISAGFSNGLSIYQHQLELLESLYRSTTDIHLSTELKRLQNRIRSKKLLGRDLLRLSTPPAEKRVRILWDELQNLKSVYDKGTGVAGSFESRYDVYEEIGQGGMSRVFRAIRHSDSQEVAIKYLRDEFFHSPSMVARFQRECRLSRSFEHPHIIKTDETGEHGGKGFMVMEYLPLGGIDQYLDRPGFSSGLALVVLNQTARGLAYLHERNVVHRDVKLSNLLVAKWDRGSVRAEDQQLQVKLTDFGLSKEVSDDGLTRIGTKMGTDYYAAPEQRIDPASVDQRADLYSLGVCMYRLLVRTCFPEGDFPKITEVHPELPRDLDALLMQCLKVNREHRISSAVEFEGQLDGIVKLMQDRRAE